MPCTVSPSGVSTHAYWAGELPEPVRDELRAVARAWLGRVGERGFSMNLDDLVDGRRPECLVMVARDAAGRPVGYQRYALCAVTGVSPGDDDDDAAAAQERATQREERPRPVKQAQSEPSTPAAALPTQAGDAARRLLKGAVEQNGWSLDKVIALYAETHDGADIRQATARDVETFRKSLFSRPDHELRDEAKEAS